MNLKAFLRAGMITMLILSAAGVAHACGRVISETREPILATLISMLAVCGVSILLIPAYFLFRHQDRKFCTVAAFACAVAVMGVLTSLLSKLGVDDWILQANRSTPPEAGLPLAALGLGWSLLVLLGPLYVAFRVFHLAMHLAHRLGLIETAKLDASGSEAAANTIRTK